MMMMMTLVMVIVIVVVSVLETKRSTPTTVTMREFVPSASAPRFRLRQLKMGVGGAVRAHVVVRTRMRAFSCACVFLHVYAHVFAHVCGRRWAGRRWPMQV